MLARSLESRVSCCRLRGDWQPAGRGASISRRSSGVFMFIGIKSFDDEQRFLPTRTSQRACRIYDRAGARFVHAWRRRRRRGRRCRDLSRRERAPTDGRTEDERTRRAATGSELHATGPRDTARSERCVTNEFHRQRDSNYRAEADDAHGWEEVASAKWRGDHRSPSRRSADPADPGSAGRLRSSVRAHPRSSALRTVATGAHLHFSFAAC